MTGRKWLLPKSDLCEVYIFCNETPIPGNKFLTSKKSIGKRAAKPTWLVETFLLPSSPFMWYIFICLNTPISGRNFFQKKKVQCIRGCSLYQFLLWRSYPLKNISSCIRTPIPGRKFLTWKNSTVKSKVKPIRLEQFLIWNSHKY